MPVIQKVVLLVALLIVGQTCIAQKKASEEPFLWGAASAAFQVEGASTADDKGPSIWDVYLDDDHAAGPGISGRVAINFYDRDQYLKDIALMKVDGSDKLSLLGFVAPNHSGRAWSGKSCCGSALSAVHCRSESRRHSADADPLPLGHAASLAAAGGWENRASIEWFKRYAEVIFANFSDQVNLFVLVNEPLIERDLKTTVQKKLAGGTAGLNLLPQKRDLEVSLKSFNHILLASAAAKRSFTAKGYKGRLGLALPLLPVLTEDRASSADKAAATFADGVLNRWFLDAMFKGIYPADILSYAKEAGMNLDVDPGDAAAIFGARFDYLGVNYYAPAFVRHTDAPEASNGAETFFPSGVDAAFNGPVRPDQLKSLLDRIRTEYGNPTVFITENGAGFPGEDVLVNGAVNDVRRCRYIVRHVAAMRQAIADGDDVRGYYVWSSHDNLEWISGYGSRFGLIYVDFDTQQRTPKLSSQIYSRLIHGEALAPEACGK